MADWGTVTAQGQAWEQGGSATGTSLASTVATNGAHGKGTYVELVASTARDAEGFWLNIVGANNNGVNALVDVAIGAASSEVVIVSNLYVYATGVQIGDCIYLPVRIPAGSRVAARCQTNVSARSLLMQVLLAGSPFVATPGLSRSETFGAVTASTDGTSIDPGGAANTKVVTELASATVIDAKAVLLCIKNNDQALLANTGWLVDLCVGAGGSEVAVIENLQLYATTSNDEFPTKTFGPFFCGIPAGSRLSLRAQCSATDAGDRVLKAVAVLFG
jgi:hypothetical protein